MSSLGVLKGYLIACATQILHRTFSSSPHNAPYSPSYYYDDVMCNGPIVQQLLPVPFCSYLYIFWT